MFGEELYSVSEWLIIGVVVLLLIGATEVGFVFGRRIRDLHEHVRSQITTLQAAILGLLALLLGFTFSMSIVRYDARKQLVLDEANAIGTAFLRAELLPEPLTREVSALLRRYVDVRIAFYRAGLNEAQLAKTNAETNEIHDKLWKNAVIAGQKNPQAVTIGLFIQSVNDVIDLHSKRLAAIDNHVPALIFVLLYFVAIVTMAIVGYGFGLGGSRSPFVTIVSAILIVAVIFLIVDLDRPRRGLESVGQKSLLELTSSIQK